MKDELNADLLAIGDAAIAIFEQGFAEMKAGIRRRQAEQEYQDLSLVFFCKYGKFPDEV
jgi:hypothetical protein